MTSSLIQGHYTVPEISTANPKDWYVFFRFTHAGKEYPRKYREGVNRIKDKASRMEEALKLCQRTKDWLELGWNPITDPKFKLRKIKPKGGNSSMLLNDALDYAYGKKKSLKKSSKANYSNMLDFIKEVAVKTGHSLIEVKDMDRGACLDLMDECSNIRDFSNHAYNKYTGCLRSMLSELLDRRIIGSNPLYDFRGRIVPESNKYAPYTADEKRRIEAHLKVVHPRLFVVMSVVYHTGIRPQEVLELQIRNVDLKERIITVAQELDNPDKSKTTSVVHLKVFLLLIG